MALILKIVVAMFVGALIYRVCRLPSSIVLVSKLCKINFLTNLYLRDVTLTLKKIHSSTVNGLYDMLRDIDRLTAVHTRNRTKQVYF